MKKKEKTASELRAEKHRLEEKIENVEVEIAILQKIRYEIAKKKKTDR